MPEEVQLEQETQTSPEEQAKEDGWVSREEWVGDPSDWKTAEDFLKFPAPSRAQLRAKNDALYQEKAQTKRELAEVRRQLTDNQRTMDALLKMQGKVAQAAYEQAKSELIARQERAVEESDTKEFNRLEAEKDKLDKSMMPPPNQPSPMANIPPEVVAWANERPWFMSDPILTLGAQYEFQKRANSRKPISELLNEVEAALQEAHPERFGLPPKSSSTSKEPETPAVFSGDGYASKPPDKTAKGYEKLPQAAKTQFKAFVESGVFKDDKPGRDQYAKDFFAHKDKYEED